MKKNETKDFIKTINACKKVILMSILFPDVRNSLIKSLTKAELKLYQKVENEYKVRIYERMMSHML